MYYSSIYYYLYTNSLFSVYQFSIPYMRSLCSLAILYSLYFLYNIIPIILNCYAGLKVHVYTVLTYQVTILYSAQCVLLFPVYQLCIIISITYVCRVFLVE